MPEQLRLPNKLNTNGRCAFLKLNKACYFFNKVGDDIFYRVSLDGTAWSSTVPLVKNVLGAFDIDSDGQNIYVVYTKKLKYDLCLLTLKENKWSEEVISFFSPEKGIPFYPKLVPANGVLHIFASQVCTYFPGTWHIKHYFKSKTWNCVDLDKGEGVCYNYLAGVINDGSTFHLLYRYFNKGFYQLKYSFIEIANRTPITSSIITQSPSSKYAPYFFKLGKNYFTVFLSRTGYELKLYSIGEKGGNWGRERLLLKDKVQAAYPFVVQDEKNTNCYFLINNYWASLNFFYGEKQRTDYNLIGFFKKNGGESFMSESYLSKEIKKEVEAELKIAKKENEDLQVMVAKLTAELEETKSQKEDMEHRLFQAEGDILSLKEQMAEQQRLEQQLRGEQKLELQQLEQQLREKDTALQSIMEQIAAEQKKKDEVQPEETTSSLQVFRNLIKSLLPPNN